MNGKIRFAPSPTGYLHEGHLLSALYVWAAAKKWNLHIHLRIEDHDRGRTRQAYIDGIREDLEWLGFQYHSQSIQSERQEIYREVLQKLTDHNLVYPCTCSRKQLESENPRSNTGEIIYQGKCRNLAENLKAKGESYSSCILPPHNLRFRITDKIINWQDLRLGSFSENPAEQCGDFPIVDRDGFFTYQFCVCVDDLDQGITHIVRGEDIVNSTARQIELSQAICQTTGGTIGSIPLEYPHPTYLHHGLITDPSGKKLSKRELAHSIRQDKEAGVTPEQLLGRVLFKAGFQQTDTPVTLPQAIDFLSSTL
ncbi:MAG: glutamate--tRNA ligase family protein [Fibrobacter sp.]|nr:glutamate--tRNA ligase family protein [Fibrobacter sp.]